MVKRRYISPYKGYIAILIILALNLIGVSYAFWEQDLEINTSIYTGAMDYSLEAKVTGELEGLEVETDGRQLIISGTLDEDDQGCIIVKVLQEGTVPFTLREGMIPSSPIITAIKIDNEAKKFNLYIEGESFKEKDPLIPPENFTVQKVTTTTAVSGSERIQVESGE